MTGKSSQQRKALGASFPGLRFALGMASAGTMLIALRDRWDFIPAYDPDYVTRVAVSVVSSYSQISTLCGMRCP